MEQQHSSSVCTLLEQMNKRQIKFEKDLHVITEKQKDTAVVCKNILHLLKKQEKKNIDQYKVSFAYTSIQFDPIS